MSQQQTTATARDLPPELRHDDTDTLVEALNKIGLREAADRAAGMVVFGLVKDVSHWHEYDIYTSRQLWDYLEGC